MLAKIEMNNSYINQIITGQSDLFKLIYQIDLGDDKWEVIVEDQAGAAYSGIVHQNEKNEYDIVGDMEFNRVYPVKDTKGKVVKIKHSEEFPPG